MSTALQKKTARSSSRPSSRSSSRSWSGSSSSGSPGDSGLNLADYVGEAFLFLGAGASVLLQMSEPGVGRGVADHSTALVRPLNRLRATMGYVYAVTLGTPEEQHEIIRHVNKAHVPVRSETYNAFDPELQLWVTATLYMNGTTLYERFFGRIDDEAAERIYQQAAVYGTALQMKPEMWPANRAEFAEYWEHKLATLEVDDSARDFIHKLLSGGNAPWPVRLLMPFNRFVTTGMLPQRIREQLELPWNREAQLAFDLFMAVTPPVYRMIPGPLRRLPSTYYMWDMRRRLRSGRGFL